MADDYERLAEKTELTYEEALALKKEMVKRHEIDETLADLVHPAAGWSSNANDQVRSRQFLEPTAADAARRGERDESPRRNSRYLLVRPSQQFVTSPPQSWIRRRQFGLR